MSEFYVRVVKVGNVEKHPNADSLSMTLVDGGYPVIFKTGEYNEGDLAAYVPIDSVVPDLPQWDFLGGHRRIKAKKLRGIFSMGMLTKLPDGEFVEGQNVQELLGVTKYEPEMKATFKYAENEPDVSFVPKYTDIEGLRKYKNLLVPGEEVVVTEKIHGMNGRWLYKNGRFYVGSRNFMKKESSDDPWWKVLKDDEAFVETLVKNEGTVFYGEVYGRGAQDLVYDAPDGLTVRIFDMFDTEKMSYLDWDEYVLRMEFISFGVKYVPVLFHGSWSEDLMSLAEGVSKLGSNVREGFVVRPIKERWDRSVGRVILKMVGEGYLLRKGA